MKLNFPDKYNTAILLLISLCTLFPQPILADENLWSTNGPAGGSVKTIAIQPFNNQIVYLGTISNGIYRSDNGGGSWQHLDLGIMENTQRVIAIHPFAPETLYAATARGLFKSSNGGVDWEFIILPIIPQNELTALLIHPLDPSLVITGGPTCEWISTDSGQSWTQLNIPHNTGIKDLEIDPSNQDIIYLIGSALYSGNGVWKSEDRGLTWSNIQNDLDTIGFCTDIEVDPIDSQLLYLSLITIFDSTDACMFKSTNGGQNWFEITPEALTLPYILQVQVSAIDHSVVLIGTSQDGVLKSTDGGSTWQPKNEGLRSHEIACLAIDSLTGIIYLGTYYQGIFRSTDDGESWEEISQNLHCGWFSDLAIGFDDPNLGYVIGYSGFFGTIDGGNSWDIVDAGIPPDHGPSAVKLDRYNPASIYLTVFSRTLYHTPGTGFYRSTDEGTSWEFFNAGLPDDITYSGIAITYGPEPERRIFLTSAIGLFFSDDLGETWQICGGGLPTNIDITEIDIAASEQDVIGIGDFYNHIFISSDRGESWTQAQPFPDSQGYYINDLAFCPTDPSVLYAGSANIGLLRTTNFGVTWENYNHNLPLSSPPYTPVVSGITLNPLNPENMFVITNHRGVYQSHNGGLDWEAFNAGLDTTLSSGAMMFAPGDTIKLYLAASTRSVWSIERTVGIPEDGNILPRSVAIGAYPNPFNSRVRLSYALPAAGPAAVTIYDVTGRQVQSLFEGYRPAGNHEFIWDASSVASGIYFYQLQAGEERQTAKITLLK